MSNIAIKGATTGTGTFTIESPATNTDRTLTLPDEAGTVVTSASADFAVDVTTTANVGAGTASPAAKLDVHNSSFGGSATTLHLSSTNSASEVVPYAGLGYVVDQGADGIEAGSLTLSTYSSSALTERMRIDSIGRININATAFTAGYLNVLGDSSTTDAVYIQQNNNTSRGIWTNCTGSSFSDSMELQYATRANTSSYFFHRSFSSAGSDQEFYVRGDGQTGADGSFFGGGADYAEYFEWSDGNTSNEDRRGYTVVLDGNMIRKATDADDTSRIIGAVSSRPSVVGDADMDAWKGKYLKDDFGQYIRDENGERILNTDYDESQEYTPREDRPEWSPIGMMGKLRIRKGQPVGDRWIKMRDVSETVEEWLVR